MTVRSEGIGNEYLGIDCMMVMLLTQLNPFSWGTRALQRSTIIHVFRMNTHSFPTFKTAVVVHDEIYLLCALTFHTRSSTLAITINGKV